MLDSKPENRYPSDQVLLNSARTDERDAFFGTRKPITSPLNHLTAADSRFGLGNSRPEGIEVIKPVWDEGMLIWSPGLEPFVAEFV